MDNIERFNNFVSFKPVDRLPMIEWAYWWDKTIDRWHGEGLPAELTDAWDISDFFGLDYYRQFWISPVTADITVNISHGTEIIKNKKDYDNILPVLYPKDAFDEKIIEGLTKLKGKREAVIWFTFEGFFWHPRVLFGIENHMYAFYDHGSLMKRINERLTEYMLDLISKICNISQPCFMTFAEDMSYNKGPMLSKDCFDEFLAPYYKQVVPELKKRNIVPIIDSDGDVTALLPWIEEVGIEGILPLERQAGVDVALIRKNHPTLKLIGGFDKTVMHLGEHAMRQEFERLLPVMKLGGYIPSVDHQTPPDVSIHNYRSYVSLLREYCEKCASETVF